MVKKPEWPEELKKPFPFEDPLIEFDRQRSSNKGAAEGKAQASDAEAKKVRPFAAEVNRRLKTMARYLDPADKGRLDSEDDWQRFLYRLCRHWKIPGFHQKSGAGRPKIRTPEMRRMLVADVLSVMERRKGTKARDACRFMARNPQKYLERYRDKDSTLYREYQRSMKLVGRRLRHPRERDELFKIFKDDISAAAVTQKWNLVLSDLFTSSRSEEFQDFKKALEKYPVHAPDSAELIRFIFDK